MTQSVPQPQPVAGPEFPARIWSVLVRSLVHPPSEGGQKAVPFESEDVWQLGGVVPGSTDLAVVAIYPSEQQEGGVDVFAVPKPQTDFAKNGQAVIITLAANVIRQMVTIVSGEVWHRLMRDTREVATDDFTAAIASKWTGIPKDLLLEHLADAREDLREEEGEEEGEPDKPALPAAPNGTSEATS